MAIRIGCAAICGRSPDPILSENRDHALTTDFRTVVGEVLTKHIGVKDLSMRFRTASPWGFCAWKVWTPSG
jgi:uncharacterized protein (DUF1501 family)